MELFFDFRRSPDRPLDLAEVEQREQLLECYQTFLGHELPNLLVPLQAFCRLLLPPPGSPAQEKTGFGPETRTLLEQVANLAAGVDGLVRRVAELGRLCREPPLGPPISLLDVVREAAAEVHCTGTPFDCVPSPDLPVVNLSRRLLQQVFVQLFRNAAQAAPNPGTPVRVEVEGAVDPPAFPAWGVAVSIRDNGRGLSGSRAAQLFQPFNPSAGGPPGTRSTALGLFLVRHILTRWAGAVLVRSTLENRPTTGGSTETTFTLLLPRTDEAREAT
jgi:signal transduction histidine kinase